MDTDGTEQVSGQDAGEIVGRLIADGAAFRAGLAGLDIEAFAERTLERLGLPGPDPEADAPGLPG